MLRAGTTTLEAKSGYGLDRETELKMLRVLLRLDQEGPVRSFPRFWPRILFPPEFAGPAAEYVRFVAEELIPEVAPRALPSTAMPSAMTMRSPWRKPAPCWPLQSAMAWAFASMLSSFVPARARRLPLN